MESCHQFIQRGSFFIQEHTALKIIAHDIYERGRLSSLKLEINEQQIQILNIYAPNNPSERKRYEPRHEKTSFLHMRKTKTQMSFAVTAKLISAFVFAIRIVQSLYYP